MDWVHELNEELSNRLLDSQIGNLTDDFLMKALVALSLSRIAITLERLDWDNEGGLKVRAEVRT